MPTVFLPAVLDVRPYNRNIGSQRLANLPKGHFWKDPHCQKKMLHHHRRPKLHGVFTASSFQSDAGSVGKQGQHLKCHGLLNDYRCCRTPRSSWHTKRLSSSQMASTATRVTYLRLPHPQAVRNQLNCMVHAENSRSYRHSMVSDFRPRPEYWEGNWSVQSSFARTVALSKFWSSVNSPSRFTSVASPNALLSEQTWRS